MSLSNFRMSPSPSVTLGEYKQRKTILNTILKKVIFQILSNMHLNFAII